MNKLRNIKNILLVMLFYTSATTAMAGSAHVLNDDKIYGQPLETSESVITALNGGAIVKASIDLSKCTPQDGGTTLNIKGGLVISSYKIEEDGTLLFVDSVNAATEYFSGSLEPIADFVKYSVSPDGAITFTSNIYSIPDYNLIQQFAFDCSINNGVNFIATY
jgi:hypothetical protein